MTADVLFFGATADVVGTRRKTLEIGSPEPAKVIFDRILTDYPALSKHRLLFAINQRYVNGDEIVNDGDELAIFTAVSGG
jgi:molybdopterin converting factor small subunit